VWKNVDVYLAALTDPPYPILHIHESDAVIGLLVHGTEDVQSYGNHLSQVQVEYPGTTRDIPRCPRVFLGQLGPGARDCQSLGHHMIS